MDQVRSIDIDNEWDFDLAEYCIKRRSTHDICM